MDNSDCEWLQSQIDKMENRLSDRIDSLETSQHSICIFLKRFIVGKKVKCSCSFKQETTKWGNRFFENGAFEGIVLDMEDTNMLFADDITCDISKIEEIYD